MPINIVRGDEPVTITSLVALIYGEPGWGKTSLAFTAEAPLLFDFDKGAHRSHFRQDSVPVTAWSDISDLTADDLKDYQTVIVDTAGRCLDALAAEIISRDPKMGQRDGALTLKGYGALKTRFAAWLSMLRGYGKDVVLIAHDKEDKRGDDLIVRPEITGGSYNEVFKCADAVGYGHVVGKKRMLEFSPSDSWVAKNPAGLEPIEVPTFHQHPQFFGELIQQIKDSIGSISEESKKVADQVQAWREAIEAEDDAGNLSAFIEEIKKEDKPVAVQAKRLLWDHAKACGLEFDKDAGAFVVPKEEAEA